MRNAILFILLVLVIATVSWLVTQSVDKLEAKKDRLNMIANLPPLYFTDPEHHGVSFQKLANNRQTVLVLFHSDCEHCHYEAKEIASNLARAEDVLWVFVSEEPIDTIQAFRAAYFELTNPHVVFGQSDIKHLLEIFQSVRFPAVFIYGADGQLQKEFRGEVTFDAITHTFGSFSSAY